MRNETVGMWGATDLNDLIRGLKMTLAQAEDVRAQGGTLADMQSIGTCGTCPKDSFITCGVYGENDSDPYGIWDYVEGKEDDERECGENCPDYQSYECLMHCNRNPYCDDEDENEDENEEECGENCSNYGSYYCDMECNGYPYSDEDEDEDNECASTDRILKDTLAVLDEILAEYDKRNKR